MKVKLGNKEYTIQFGFKPTLQSKLIVDVVKAESATGEEIDAVQDMLMMLPKMLLVGLQVHHNDEFGYDSEKKYNERLEKVFDLVAEKIDSGEINCIELISQLEKELEENSFLAQMMEAERKKQRASKKTPSKTTTTN